MNEAINQPVTVSIVSHGQGEMVAALLSDLARCVGVCEVLVTQNIPEAEIVCPESMQSRLRLICNAYPKGFAANHNQAFQQCKTPLFAVLNPDIRLVRDPFSILGGFIIETDCGLAVPAVRNQQGLVEDSVRYFPTPVRLLAKLLKLSDGRYPLKGEMPFSVDWAAGMFMLFQAEVFRDMGGFDEGFFLYYEDVDICVRLWKAGQCVVFHPGVSVIHVAQRASRRRPRYMVWHFFSMMRYFYKHLRRLPRHGVGS